MYCHTLPCCALPLLLHKFIISSLLITTASLNNKYPLLREHVFVCANPRQLFPVSVSRHRFWGHITIQRQFKRHGLRLRRWFIAFPGIKKSIKTKILSTPVFHCLHFISLPSISPFCRAVQSRQVYSFHPWARWVTCSKSQPTYFTIKTLKKRLFIHKVAAVLSYWKVAEIFYRLPLWVFFLFPVLDFFRWRISSMLLVFYHISRNENPWKCFQCPSKNVAYLWKCGKCKQCAIFLNISPFFAIEIC